MAIGRGLCSQGLKPRRWAGLLLLMACTACGAEGRSADQAAAPGCPAAAQAVVTGFYDWYIAAGDRYRDDLQVQRGRLAPQLYADLQRAFALSAAEGAARFLDVDPFSGTQVGSYGYRLLSCQAAAGGGLEAELAVRSGLSPERASEHPLVLLLQRGPKGWRIAGIDFPQAEGQPERLHLQELLDELLAEDAGDGSAAAPDPAADSEVANGADASGSAGGRVLITPGFRVEVERHCLEGTIVCDRVSYVGQDRRSGASLRLTGSTDYRLCADGLTPCQFLGYRFRNGSVVYEVTDDGRLRVLQGGRLLLEEQGTWQP